MACNHLPDPYNERDLTSFMTLWAERPDKTLTEAIDNCQTAETVNSVMQDISGEAMAVGNSDKLVWCNKYIEGLREIELRKYDEITSYIFEYMEVHSKRTPEEIATFIVMKRVTNVNNPSEKSLRKIESLACWRYQILI